LIKPGDSIIGIPSSGIHSNGYSMVRKLFFDIKGYELDRKIPGLDGTLGEILWSPQGYMFSRC
jgi:phosphoribosylformylglycinamidine cyclo-ligase